MPTAASSTRVLSSQHRSSFVTDQWPSPPCSHRPSQGCAPPPQPKDATSPRQAAPSAPGTCPRLPSHHSYPKGDEVPQNVQVIFARLLSITRPSTEPYKRRSCIGFRHGCSTAQHCSGQGSSLPVPIGRNLALRIQVGARRR